MNPQGLRGNTGDLTERRKLRLESSESHRNPCPTPHYPLPESESMYRLLFENSLDAIFLAQPDGTILAANQAACSLFGMTEAEICCAGRAALVDPEDPRLLKALEERAQTGVFKGELTCVRRDGTKFPVEVNSTSLDDGARSFVIVRDITERRRHEANLAFLAEFSADLACLTTADEIMEMVGKKIGTFFDFSRCHFADIDEVAGIEIITPDRHQEGFATRTAGRVHRLTDFFTPELYEEARSGKIVVVRDTQTDPRIHRENSGASDIRSHIAVPISKDGHWQFMLSVSDTVPRDWREDEVELVRELAARVWLRLERVRADEVLRKSGERLRSHVENTPLAVIEWGPEFRLSGWSGDAERIFGWKAEEVVGKRMDEFRWIHDDDIQQVAEVAMGLISGTRARSISHNRNYRKDGAVIYCEWYNSSLQNASGKLQSVLSLVLDVTERKRAEEELRHAKAMADAANAAKSRFLANMSHELRTPMNAILGMIDVALPKANDPTVQDCLRTVKGSADLLLTLLNDLLDSAKIESGKLELEASPFSLRRMLDQLTRVLSVRASEKGLTFYCRMPEETPDVVVGDRMRLQQILLNLAGNAIKFTERGEVEIQLRALAHDDDARLEFAVRDTGIGISLDGMAHLFQPFSQADASMTRRFGGTGLGLSICKNLVEMMGGHLWVESDLGQGSTFSFTIQLPLAEELPADSETLVPLPVMACAPLHILLVEDNIANQKLATYILRDRGHTVEIAGDGAEALCLSEKNRYDVIFMDVQMPGMNGLEATATIRKREAGDERVPIIAMTAHAMRGDREECLAAGMDGYLSKPIKAPEMIRLVESLTSSTVPSPRTVTTATATEATSAATATIFDRDAARSLCLGNEDTLREVTQFFFDEVESLFPLMRASMQKGDLVEVGRLGHRMKGTLVYLGAQPALEAALGVERFGKSEGGTASEAAEAVKALEHACRALKTALTEQPFLNDLAQNG